MDVLFRGAESIIYLGEHDGQAVLVKERIRKAYRIPQIDEKLRKVRTKKEAKLLTEARKAGVPTPSIREVSEANNSITMEFIDGERVKEFLGSSRAKGGAKISLEIGRLVGKLHSAGIIHGDLTTSNMIMKGKTLYLIDFGLGDFSRKAEDQGVDINLLREALKSTHMKILNICWRNIVRGYVKEFKGAQQVIKKVDEIERRARYAERKGHL